ncbi:MAG: ACP phosphodiesterase [Geobacteraceae bacterium GWC2_53_11]|nr:MAG: ACP phosphodiesterase [Geobacteraceae bacterium GWC2_53_11]
MNILFHMYLSGNDPELLVGNFMGDFVKGPIGSAFAPRICQGLKLHRKIDSFAQGNAHFQASRLRLNQRYGLYRGVFVDLFYDHFLAREWPSWSDTPLPEYLASTRAVIDSYLPVMPQRLQEFVPVIFGELLPSYAKVSGIEAALGRMSRRVRRTNPLAEGSVELSIHYEALQADFRQFITEARLFASDFIAQENSI